MQKDRWRKKLDQARKRFIKGVRAKAGTQPPIGRTLEQTEANLNALMDRFIQRMEKKITPKTKRRNK